VKRVIVIIVLLLAAAVAVLYERRLIGHPPAQAAAAPVLSVSTQPVTVAPMIQSATSYGNLVSERSVNIVAEAPGIIKEILFTDGQTVAAGAPLVMMDSSVAEAQLRSSRAQAETDIQNLRRVQSLSRRGLDSTSSLEQAQARASASQADVTISERKLAQLTLRAPFAGVLGSSNVDVGSYVTSAVTIVRLEDTSRLRIEFRVPSSVAGQASEGIPVHVQLPGAGGDQIVGGRLSFIDPTISTDTRSVLLRAVVSNSDRHLRPGLFVRVNLDLRTHPDALVVPVEAVTTDLNGSYVFVVNDKNVVQKRAVTIGLTDGEREELLDGVKAGDQVVTIGQFRVRDGDTVKVVSPPPVAKSAS
jgi:RND family efflux transporter MFP subunit